MRFEAECRRLILNAAGIARRFGHSYVGSEHLLTAFSNEPDWMGQLLGSCGFNSRTAQYAVSGLLGVGTPDMPK